MKKHASSEPVFSVLAMLAFLSAFVLIPMPAGHAEAPSFSDQGAVSASIMKITPEMSPNVLKSLADDDLVELPSGRKMVVGDIRRLSQKARAIRSATFTGEPMRQAFQVQPAPAGVKLKNRADLVSALSLPGGDTVELPSGRRLTVEQLRLLQPYVEKRLGRKLTRLETPSLKGTAINVTSSTDKGYWRDILRKPDDTILEAPDGTRITVGDLKAALSATKAPGDSSGRVSP